MNFTEEELEIAKRADLCAVAEQLGYTVKRIGKYHTLKEMDSIRIYDRSHWFRWSRQYEKGRNGGSQIDFLRVFAGMEVKDAVFWLLDFLGYQREEKEHQKIERMKEQRLLQESKKPKEHKPFVLPEYAGSNAYLYHYLLEERKIAKRVVDDFVARGLLYEEKQHHNLVFVGKDGNGTPRFASMRGVFDKNGKGFRCDVAGNDKRYGVNYVVEHSRKAFVFEAAIDLMSYQSMYPEQRENMLALGMLADAPLESFLKEHPKIEQIMFCLDNDLPGREATKRLLSKYKELGYEVADEPAPKEYKDYNEWLKKAAKEKEQGVHKEVLAR